MSTAQRTQGGPFDPKSLEVRPAATVAVLRDSSRGVEVLMVRRSARLAFYGGAWVFPGGRVEASDGDIEHALTDAARNAGARELHEEAGLQVQAEALIGYSRWLTPPGRPRRFDTFNFAVRAPEGEVKVDLDEIDAFQWLTASEALAARLRGELELPPPTFVTLSIFEAFTSVDDACAQLAAEPVHYIPRPFEVEGGLIYLYPGDAGYEAGDLDAAGAARHRLHAVGRDWRYERALRDRA